jgi:hypothetical protein
VKSICPSLKQKELLTIEGKWKGYIIQKVSGKNKRIETEITIRKSAKHIEGEAELMDDVLGKAHIILYNGVFNGRVLKIDYRNKKTQIFQYGAIVMLMNNEGSKLSGTYVGFSPTFNRIICGDIAFFDKVEI